MLRELTGAPAYVHRTTQPVQTLQKLLDGAIKSRHIVCAVCVKDPPGDGAKGGSKGAGLPGGFKPGRTYGLALAPAGGSGAASGGSQGASTRYVFINPWPSKGA